MVGDPGRTVGGAYRAPTLRSCYDAAFGVRYLALVPSQSAAARLEICGDLVICPCAKELVERDLDHERRRDRVLESKPVEALL